MANIATLLKISILSTLLVSCKFLQPEFSTDLVQGNSFDTKRMDKVTIGTTSKTLIEKFGFPALTHPYKANTNWVYLKYHKKNKSDDNAKMTKFLITLDNNTNKVKSIKKYVK